MGVLAAEPRRIASFCYSSTFIFGRSLADLLGFAILPLPFLTCVLNKNALATKEARRKVNARRKAHRQETATREAGRQEIATERLRRVND